MIEEITKRSMDSLLEEKKNVRVTVSYDDMADVRTNIDFPLITRYLKRFFALWLAFSVAFGALSGSIAVLTQRYFLENDVRALLSFNLAGDANLEGYISKMKSPIVLEDALNASGIDLSCLEDIQGAISISGIVPDSAYDKMSMYYDIISQTGQNAIETVQNLLNTSYHTVQFIVSLDYRKAGLSMENGASFMDALLDVYQKYFSARHDENVMMGNALASLDYRDYDYAEAAHLFSTILDNVDSALTEAQRDGGSNFRSVNTGFTFQDLKNIASMLREIDLDLVSAYVVIHSVSVYDPATEIRFYEWRIDNLQRERAVERTRLDSLTSSIAAYEKDPILIAVAEGNSVTSVNEETNTYYDNMIREKLDAQASVASYTRSIMYYERVIERFQALLENASAEGDGESVPVSAEPGQSLSSPEDIEKVAEYLASLNTRTNALIENATLTLNEFYETTAFSNRVRVLIPASVDNPPLVSLVTLVAVGATEALVLMVYLSYCFFKGVSVGNRNRKRENMET